MGGKRLILAVLFPIFREKRTEPCQKQGSVLLCVRWGKVCEKMSEKFNFKRKRGLLSQKIRYLGRTRATATSLTLVPVGPVMISPPTAFKVG